MIRPWTLFRRLKNVRRRFLLNKFWLYIHLVSLRAPSIRLLHSYTKDNLKFPPVQFHDKRIINKRFDKSVAWVFWKAQQIKHRVRRHKQEYRVRKHAPVENLTHAPSKFLGIISPVLRQGSNLRTPEKTRI